MNPTVRHKRHIPRKVIMVSTNDQIPEDPKYINHIIMTPYRKVVLLEEANNLGVSQIGEVDEAVMVDIKMKEKIIDN